MAYFGKTEKIVVLEIGNFEIIVLGYRPLRLIYFKRFRPRRQNGSNPTLAFNTIGAKGRFEQQTFCMFRDF